MDKIEFLESRLAVVITLPEKIDTLNALAWELRFDDVLRAKSLSEAAYELTKDADKSGCPYPKGLAESLRNLGHCHERLGNYEEEILLLTEALSLFEALADLSGQATVLYLLGSAYWTLGNYYDSLERILKSIELCEQINERFSLAKAWNIVGLVYQSIGNLTEALEYYLKSLQIYEELGDKRGQGDTLSNSCEAAFELGDCEQALAFGLRSLQLHEEINYTDDLGTVLTAVGRAYLALGQPEQALYCLHRGLNVSSQGANRYSELRCLVYLAEAYNQQRQNDLALSFAQQALPLAQQIETKLELSECYRILADIYKQEADFEKALAAYEQFHTIKEGLLNEIAKHKLDILGLVQRLEVTKREAEVQHLKNIQLEHEIAERQKAQTALLESEQKYRELVEHANSIILRIDRQGRLTFFNEFAQKFFDYRAAEIVGQPVVGTIVPERDSMGRDLRDLIREIGLNPEQYIHNENENIRRNGERVWVAWTNKAVTDEAGNLVEILCIGTDITARKQALEQLLLAQERLQHLLTSSPAIIFSARVSGNYGSTFVSDNVVTQLGYTPEEFTTQPDFWINHIHPNDMPLVLEGLELLLECGQYTYTYRFLHRDGTYRCMREQVTLIHDAAGQPLEAVGAWLDITEQMKAEQALHHSEERLRRILSSISDHIYLTEVTPDGRRLNHYMSPTEPLTGYPLEKMLADWSFWPTELIHPDDQAQAAAQAQRLAQGQSSEVEYRLIRADGCVIWVRDSGRVESEPGSQSLFVYGIVSDITARKQAEEALRQSEAKTRAILNAIPDLMFRLDRAGRFIDFSAHDVAEWYVQPEMFMGKTISETLPPEVVEATLYHIQRAFETNTIQVYEYQLALPDQEPQDFEARLVVSGEDEVLAIVRDITKRKQAEEALVKRTAELEEVSSLLDNIIENLPAMLFMKEAKTLHFTRFNKAAEELVGLQREQVLDKSDYDFFPIDQANFFVAKDREVLASRNILEIEEETIQTVQQGLRWLYTRKTPILGTDGRPKYLLGVSIDITERKRAEAALRQSEARQRALLEAIPDLILRISRDGTYLDCKPAKDFNTLQIPTALIGKKVHEVLPFEVVQQRMQYIEKALQTGVVQTFEFQISLSDGQRHEQEARIAVSGMDEVLVIVRDITERKKIELERMRFTAQLRTAAEISKQVSAILDPKVLLHYVVTLLQSHLNLYHVHIYLLNETSGELRVVAGSGEIGKILEERSHTITLEQERSLVAQAVRSQEIVWIRDVSQEPNFLPNPFLPDTRTEVALPLIASGKVLGVLDVQENQVNYFKPSDVDTFSALAGQIAIALDNARLYEATQREVLERKQAEEALRQARDELAARVDELETLNFVIRTVTTTPDLEAALAVVPKTMVQLFKAQRSGVALLNKAGTALRVEAEFCRDERMESTVGTLIPVDGNISSSQVLQTGQAAVIVQAPTNPSTALVHELLRRLETDSLMIVPLLVRGRAIGTIGVDRASGEPEFTAAEIKLAETIAGQIAGAIEITRLLSEEHQLREAAEVASEFKSQLLARVSHELRTPLGSILGYSELLQEGIFGPITVEQKQAAAEIMESTHYLTSLVNELLDQAQYERGNIELHLTPLSLPNLVNRVEARMSILARRKQLKLNFEIAPDLPVTLWGDQKRLQQVLINLVNNAIKFTKAGQVNVHLFKASPTHWAMEVTDTGLGISQEAQEFIFEPFRQADGSITRAHGGTGLGLAIVKQLATLMGGQVMVESVVGRGSTFRVMLPLHSVQEHTYDESSSGFNH